MGCDIVAFLEYSKDGGKSWEQYREPITRRIKEYDEDKKKEVSKTINLVEEEYNYSLGVGRDYHLFGVMAGIRSDPMAFLNGDGLNGIERAKYRARGIEPPEMGVTKGLPKNLSAPIAEETAKWSDKRCDNAASWGNIDDLRFWLQVHEGRGGTLYGWRQILERMEKLEEKGQKTRIVFWFNQ